MPFSCLTSPRSFSWHPAAIDGRGPSFSVASIEWRSAILICEQKNDSSFYSDPVKPKSNRLPEAQSKIVKEDEFRSTGQLLTFQLLNGHQAKTWTPTRTSISAQRSTGPQGPGGGQNRGEQGEIRLGTDVPVVCAPLMRVGREYLLSALLFVGRGRCQPEISSRKE